MSASDAITSIVGGVVLLLVIAWGPPFITTAGGTTTTVPFFDPALASTWAPWFVVIAVAQIAFAVIVYAARRWNWPIAIVNAALDAAFVIPAVWLLQTGQLLSPQVAGPDGPDRRRGGDRADRGGDLGGPGGGVRLGRDRRVPEGPSGTPRHDPISRA